jgi:hypothetical protein
MSRHCKYCGSDETDYIAEESFADQTGVTGWVGCYDCGRMEAIGGSQ